jgi:hypothetical protein
LGQNPKTRRRLVCLLPPQPDSCTAANVSSFDYLVGDGEHPWGHLDAERPSSLVDDEFEFRRLQRIHVLYNIQGVVSGPSQINPNSIAWYLDGLGNTIVGGNASSTVQGEVDMQILLQGFTGAINPAQNMGGVGGTRGRIHKTSCSVVISGRRE